MTVRVRLFAMLRERAGSDRVELELPDGANVGDALAALSDVTAGITCVMAVNRDYAPADRVLVAGDELALIPPVSGGSLETGPHVAIRAEPLSFDALVEHVRDPRALRQVELDRVRPGALAEHGEQAHADGHTSER